MESEGIFSHCAVLCGHTEGGWSRESSGAELYFLLCFCLGEGDSRQLFRLVWQHNGIIAHGRVVVEGDTININEFELGVAALLNRESDSVVS